MAWVNSGLYASTLAASLTGATNAPNWTNSTNQNKFFLTGTTDVTNYAAALASAVYGTHSGTEVTGTGWAAGGVAMNVGFNGGVMTPSTAVSGTSPVLMQYNVANGISVTGTTLTGVLGGYFYSTATTLYLIMGIYFGGTSYATVAGTFAVTWTSGLIATVNCATAA
jgi:hypothetical protein